MDHVPDVHDRDAARTVVSTYKGWSIARDHATGLMFVHRPDGRKYGQTSTGAGARIMRRRAIERES